MGRWLLELFNPPPRDSLTLYQKIGRVFLVTGTLILFSVLSALALAVVLFLFERIEAGVRGHYSVVEILAVLLDSLVVNVACLYVLLHIKRIDEKLIPRGGDPAPSKP